MMMFTQRIANDCRCEEPHTIIDLDFVLVKTVLKLEYIHALLFTL